MIMNNRGNKPFTAGVDGFEITDEKFKETFAAHCQIVEQISIGNTSFEPTIVVLYRELKEGMPGDVETSILIIADNFNETEDKQRIMKSIGRKCFEHRWIVVGAIMATEAWMSERSVDNPNLELQPRHDPNRKECIMIAGRVMPGQFTLGHMIPVGRDKDNNFVKDGEAISTSEIDTLLLNCLFVGYLDALKESSNKKKT